MHRTTGKVAPAPQPEHFEFTEENRAFAGQVVARYPEGRQASAVMPLLDLAQRQCGGWLPKVAMDHVALMLGMPPIRVYEVATFYSMYNLEPVGRHFVQVCTTTPCWLRGSDAVVKACETHLGTRLGETTPDGQFTLVEVECLGACVNAPMMQVGDHFYEDLTPETTVAVLRELAATGQARPGPQSGRHASEPADRTPALAPVESVRAEQIVAGNEVAAAPGTAQRPPKLSKKAAVTATDTTKIGKIDPE